MNEPSPDEAEFDEGLEGLGELVVPGGDAAELFEVGEAVFDGVALLVNRLAEGSGLLTIGFGRDHGDGAELLHDTIDNGVAVVSFVRHHALGALATVALQKWQALRGIVDVASGEDDLEGPSLCIAEQVKFTGGSTSGAANALIGFAGSASSVLVRSHCRRVHQQEASIRCTSLQAFENQGPETFPCPLAEARVDRLPLPKNGGQVAPGSPGAKDPNHALQHQHIVTAGASTAISILDTELAVVSVNFFKGPNSGRILTDCITAA